MSAFMFFSNANRDIVKAQNPGLSFTEIAREIGNRWAARRVSAAGALGLRCSAGGMDQDRVRELVKLRSGSAPARAGEEFLILTLCTLPCGEREAVFRMESVEVTR